MARFFARLFSRLFNYSYFRNACQRKIFTITNICPHNETLLRMLSLDLLDKVAKRLDFHSTTILLLDFFDKDQTSLNITRLYSTPSTRWPNGSIFFHVFCRVKNRVKNRVVWPGPNTEHSILGASEGALQDVKALGPSGAVPTPIYSFVLNCRGI